MHPIGKILVWCAWLLGFGVIAYFWATTSVVQWTEGSLPAGILLGRLAGLLATYCALMQFVLMSRGAWLEPLFGLDRLARAHRLNGYAAISLILAHPLLLGWGYGELEGRDVFSEIIALWNYAYVPFAVVGLLLFCMTVGFSIYIVRKNLKFETWYYIHVFNYAAIALIPWHQLTNGGDLVANETFRWFWVGLYTFAALNMLIWRFGMPLYRWWRHDFHVAKIVPEVPRATSVYITGKDMDRFHARGGQFILVRYLTKGMWWQEHPFSLSRLPSGEGVRNTVRQQGDFTNELPNLKPGTRVMVSGPYGAFTLEKATRGKFLFLVGGIGITPIRAMLEELSRRSDPGESILLYANRSEKDIALRQELEDIAAKMPLTIHHVFSDEPNAKEKGYIDEEKLRRLVPDITERDIFLCGPPPMMNGLRAALKSLGVEKKYIHYEEFSLTVKPQK